VAVPWNFVSAIAVVNVIPFLTVANPDIVVFGVGEITIKETFDALKSIEPL
jgi:hypothetical protein